MTCPGRAGLPAHAYIPGQTARHPDGTFDALRATAGQGMAVDALMTSPAWRTGREFFDNGFFWEAHEVWEPVWTHLPDGSGERVLVQAAIQLANAGLKAGMGRPAAIRRLCDQVGTLLSESRDMLPAARRETDLHWIETRCQSLCAGANPSSR